MNYNAKQLLPVYKELYNDLQNENFVIDKSGVKLVEKISQRITFDPLDLYIDFESRQSPRSYVKKEHKWYMSHELKIDQVKDIEIWNKVSDSTNQINSNYGYLVFSKGNFNQFEHAYQTLKKHKDSRQALIIYTRPSIHLEWNDLDSSDFICTLYHQFFIRNNKLICVTNQRSVDAVFGIFNDIPWFHFVYNRMLSRLQETISPGLKSGDHIYIANSFHVYERHFNLLEKIVNEG